MNHPRRRGYTLVFFALLLFGLMGLAALVIDLGLARLTQRQMQTAVDAAALEGLRLRDDPNWPPSDREAARRERSAALVAWTFDDNLLADAEDAVGFGAGPLVGLSGGPGDPNLNASQLLTVPDIPFYKPQLQTNLQDAPHGDMVSGQYEPSQPHQENSDYTRNDFQAGAAGDDSAFLVRMRRTNNFQNLDQVADVSSGGPAIPFLFGRGSLLPAPDPAGGYAPRHHGITVRAAAIAAARPALSVGQAYRSGQPASQDVPGSLPFALTRSAWVNLPADAARSVSISPDGTLTDVTDPMNPTVLGFVTAADAASRLVQVGGETAPVLPEAGYVANLLAGTADVSGISTGYVVLAGESAGVQNRVIGFGMGELAAGMDASTFQLTKRVNRVAWSNASVVLAGAIDAHMLAEVLAAQTGLDGQLLLAPAAAR